MQETILATGKRVAVVYAVLLVAFTAWAAGGLFGGPALRTLLVLAILLSVAGGLEYVLFQGRNDLAAARREDRVVIYHFYGIAAAAVFAGAQLVAAAELVRGMPGYFGWLAPALVYLAVIGVIGWRVFERPAMFLADSVRAAIILGLALLYGIG